METKLVTPEQYSALAMRTAKIMDRREMLLHGSLGLCTEVGEFAEGMPTVKNPKPELMYVAKEIGDGFWFCNYIISAMGMEFAPMLRFAEAMGYSQDSALADYAARAGAVGSRIKAYGYYGKALDSDGLRVDLMNVLNTLCKICGYMQLPVDAVLGLNIHKLQERYPEKYSDADAIARKDEPAVAGQAAQGTGSVGAFDPLTTLSAIAAETDFSPSTSCSDNSSNSYESSSSSCDTSSPSSSSSDF